jgi:hypothetical protein
MALTWDATKVADYETLHENKSEATKTEYLCWAMMDARIGEITKANWNDVFTRIDLLQRLRGAILRNGDEPVPYTKADIKRRIGYRTNVKTETFRARFYREYENTLFDNLSASIDESAKEQVTA